MTPPFRAVAGVVVWGVLFAATGRAQARDIRERLAAIAAQAPASEYQGDARARELRAELESLGARGARRARATVGWRLGVAETRLGREDVALEDLAAALAALPASAPPAERARILRALAVAALRIAESENCCAQNAPESCIVPLRGAAIHTRTRGSEAAIGYLTQLLEMAGDEEGRHTATWLLNLAYMTLDRFPDDVPAEHRIDPAFLRTDAPFPRFENVASALGVDTFSLAGGLIVEDFDLDGDLDLLTSTLDVRADLCLFVREEDGFREVHEAAGLAGLFGGLNMVPADFDDDGDVDVLVLRGAWLHEGGQHPNSLLRNDGVGADGIPHFTDVTLSAGLAEVSFPTQTAAWADYDGDGDLDLYVGNEHSRRIAAPSQLFRNEGPDASPRFVDVAAAAGVQNLRYAKGVTWGDYDGDGDPDLYVSNYFDRNRLYRNEGDGTFVDVADELGVQGPRRSFPAWFWDYDDDGALDLFVSSYVSLEEVAGSYTGAAPAPETFPALYHNRGDGTFEEVAAASGLGRPLMTMGSNFADVNGDGHLDIYLGTGHPDLASLVPNLMFVGDGHGGFLDVTLAGGFGHLQKGHAVAFADFDGDGDLDVFEQMGGAYEGDRFHDALYENPGFGNRWLGVKLVGERSNRSGIGAHLSITVQDARGEHTLHRHVGTGGSFGANPLEQHVGLGAAERVVRLSVSWPASGVEQVFTDVPLDARITIREGASELELHDPRPPR